MGCCPVKDVLCDRPGVLFCQGHGNPLQASSHSIEEKIEEISNTKPQQSSDLFGRSKPPTRLGFLRTEKREENWGKHRKNPRNQRKDGDNLREFDNELRQNNPSITDAEVEKMRELHFPQWIKELETI
ncbi:uncharacterized protein [Elaeis guineensis]|uniref:uncharacterized protein n=1 Tax=Elaeis guineensis var. tenera TaxID=51953 RepID=UPI003C6D1CFB